MKLYIQIDERGEIVGHPILEENARQIWQDPDTAECLRPFTRLPRQDGPYREYMGTEYVFAPDGTVQDHHIYREFTEEERRAKQERVKRDYEENPFMKQRFWSFVFNEELCMMTPRSGIMPDPSVLGEGEYFYFDVETQQLSIRKHDEE